MPVYRFEGPDGKIHRAEASTPEEAKAGLEAMWAGNKPKVSKAEDMGRSAVSGLFNTLAQVAGQVNPLDTPLRMIQQAQDVGLGVMDMAKGKLPQFHPTETAGPGSPSGTLMTNLAGQNYTPQTREGRWAKTAGSMAPAALAPGSAVRRIANVALPTIGSEGGAEISRALGGGDTAEMLARTFGALGGGALANVRIKPQPRVIPAEDQAAMRYVDKVAGKTDLAAVRGADPQLTGAEALGQPGKASLGALARREGTTGDNLNAEVYTRRTGRPTQLLETFAEASGVAPEAAAGDMQALVASGRSKAAPLYEEAYAAGGIDTPALRALTVRPSVKSAMSKAATIAAEEGRNPSELGFEVSPGSGDIPTMVSVKNPSAQTWDYVKRGLDDVIEGYRDKTTGKLVLDENGRAALETLKALKQQLVDANPAYGRALSVSGDYLSASSAFKAAGKDVFNGKLTERQFAENFVKLSEGSKQAYKGGIANQFYDLAQNSKLDPKVLRTPRVQAKLTIALGPEGAKQLTDFAELHGSMAAFEGRYAPGAGSVTQEMAAAMAEQDAMGGRGAQIVNDTLTQGPRKALGRQIQAALDTLGPTRGMSTAARDKAGATLMLSPQDMAKAIENYRALPKRGLPGVTVAPDPRLLSLLSGSGR